jgi:hypothetical protein
MLVSPDMDKPRAPTKNELFGGIALLVLQAIERGFAYPVDCSMVAQNGYKRVLRHFGGEG